MKNLRTNLVLLAERTPIVMFLALLAVYGKWLIALVAVVAVVAHELNHVVVLHWLRIGVSKVTFSFLMASTHGKREARSHTEMAVSALAGPAGGLVQAAALLGLYQYWRSPWLLAIAFIFACLNVANCAPILIVDGGHVWAALISRLGLRLRRFLTFAPLVVGIVTALWYRQWFILMFLVVVLIIMGPVDIGRTAATAQPSTTTVLLAPLSRRRVAVLGAAYAATTGGLIFVITTIYSTPGFSLDMLLQ